MTEQTEYPYWKDALFGDYENMVANVRCAVKYVFWHVTYTLLLIFGGLFLVFAVTFDKLTSNRVTQTTLDVFRGPRAKKVSRVGAKVAAWGIVIWFLALLAYMAYVEPWEFLKLLGFIAAVIVGIVAFLFLDVLYDEYAKQHTHRAYSGVRGCMGRVGAKAVETPGVRRVYGNCPVHMDVEPRWFENLMNRLEE